MLQSWIEIERKALHNERLSFDEGLSIMDAPEGEDLRLLSVSSRVREKFFGKRVKLNYLVNVKSGLCPEDCHYCSQSRVSKAEIDKYPLMSTEEIISHVERGLKMGAKRACLVGSGRGPGEQELDQFCQSVEGLKERYPGLEVCACLGLLKEGQPERLRGAGVFAYNHNINASSSYYAEICGSHGYHDRLDTLDRVIKKGLSACSGVLAGMGESDRDLVEMSLTLRDKDVDSIPVNFLVPIEKTPLSSVNNLTPQRCLQILCLFRLTNPAAEIRIAGGREFHLRSLQPLGLRVANSIFIGDYLTTKGQRPLYDLEMIRDLGYDIEGHPHGFLKGLLKEPEAVLKPLSKAASNHPGSGGKMFPGDLSEVVKDGKDRTGE